VADYGAGHGSRVATGSAAAESGAFACRRPPRGTWRHQRSITFTKVDTLCEGAGRFLAAGQRSSVSRDGREEFNGRLQQTESPNFLVSAKLLPLGRGMLARSYKSPQYASGPPPQNVRSSSRQPGKEPVILDRGRAGRLIGHRLHVRAACGRSLGVVWGRRHCLPRTAIDACCPDTGIRSQTRP